MQLSNLTNIPQKIINIFHKEAKNYGKETKFIKRNSKLTAPAFLRALLATCLSQSFTLEIFCSFLKEQGVRITKQGLHQRFNEYTEALLHHLALCSLKQFKTENLPNMDCLNGFTSVNIIDSSTVSLHRALSNIFKGSGGAASSAALKIQLMFDYLSGQIKALTLTSGCDNDQGFDCYFRKIQKQALYLMDLGYFKLDSFQRIMDGGAFFVSRLLTGTKLLSLDSKPIDLVKTLSNSGHFFSQQVLMGAKSKIPVRLIAQRLPSHVAEKRRHRLREDHRRRGSKPSAESLALQSWSVYITNSSEVQISNEDIHTVYALRWQIELVFKLSKSLMQIHHTHSTKSARVLVEIYGKFICMMMLFLLCAPVRYKNGKEISFYKACKLLLTRLNDFIHAFASIYRLEQFVKKFQESLSLFAIKDVKKKRNMKSCLSTGESF